MSLAQEYDGNETLNKDISGCFLWPEHEAYCKIVQIAQISSASLFLVISLFIILIIWVFKLYHSFLQRLILYISLCSAVLCITFLLGNINTNHNNAFCFVQALSMHYFSWATLSWVICTTINMVFILRQLNTEKSERWYHLFVWLNSAFWTIIPAVIGDFGKTEIWCWITIQHPILKFTVWYIPLLLVCMLMIVVYCYIFFHNKKVSRSASTVYSIDKSEEKRLNKQEVKPLIGFPFIYILFTIPIFIMRIRETFYPDDSQRFILVLVAVILGPSIGTCNALAYALFHGTFRALTFRKFKSALHTKIFGKKYKVTRGFDLPSYYEDAARSPNVMRKGPLVFQNKLFDQSGNREYMVKV
ncbi:cyclic AMP receptor-like protein A [Clytia hemisphaerica]|uniref:G-protein coupled receptors family 2 profile 2 domain-containing protein n=2 Tax=Clytia hemisphaerica TaxID=252671 RepID=A0A7M5X218_9CNID